MKTRRDKLSPVADLEQLLDRVLESEEPRPSLGPGGKKQKPPQLSIYAPELLQLLVATIADDLDPKLELSDIYRRIILEFLTNHASEHADALARVLKGYLIRHGLTPEDATEVVVDVLGSLPTELPAVTEEPPIVASMREGLTKFDVHRDVVERIARAFGYQTGRQRHQ